MHSRVGPPSMPLCGGGSQLTSGGRWYGRRAWRLFQAAASVSSWTPWPGAKKRDAENRGAGSVVLISLGHAYATELNNSMTFSDSNEFCCLCCLSPNRVSTPLGNLTNTHFAFTYTRNTTRGGHIWTL